MPARMNLVVAFKRGEDPSGLVTRFLACFSAQVELWQVAGSDLVAELEEKQVRSELDGGAIVLVVTTREPTIRAHVSKVGPLDVLTISAAGYEREQVRHAVMDAVHRDASVVAAAIGEELEMELGVNNCAVFVGQDVDVLDESTGTVDFIQPDGGRHGSL